MHFYTLIIHNWAVNSPIGCIFKQKASLSISTRKEFNMSLEKRVEAIAKKIEGKVQEAVGELTGNEKHKIEGQMKQVKASAMNAREDLKDKAKKIIDRT